MVQIRSPWVYGEREGGVRETGKLGTLHRIPWIFGSSAGTEVHGGFESIDTVA